MKRLTHPAWKWLAVISITMLICYFWMKPKPTYQYRLAKALSSDSVVAWNAHGLHIHRKREGDLVTIKDFQVTRRQPIAARKIFPSPSGKSAAYFTDTHIVYFTPGTDQQQRFPAPIHMQHIGWDEFRLTHDQLLWIKEKPYWIKDGALIDLSDKRGNLTLAMRENDIVTIDRAKAEISVRDIDTWEAKRTTTLQNNGGLPAKLSPMAFATAEKIILLGTHHQYPISIGTGIQWRPEGNSTSTPHMTSPDQQRYTLYGYGGNTLFQNHCRHQLKDITGVASTMIDGVEMLAVSTSSGIQVRESCYGSERYAIRLGTNKDVLFWFPRQQKLLHHGTAVLEENDFELVYSEPVANHLHTFSAMTESTTKPGLSLSRALLPQVKLDPDDELFEWKLFAIFGIPLLLMVMVYLVRRFAHRP